MFDENLPRPKTNEFPRTLENLSIMELKEYIQDLRSEIIRTEEDIQRKKVSQETAASVFK